MHALINTNRVIRSRSNFLEQCEKQQKIKMSQKMRNILKQIYIYIGELCDIQFWRFGRFCNDIGNWDRATLYN